MTSDELLEKQLTLLLAYFGEEKLLQQLAKKIGLSEESLHRQIGVHAKSSSPKRKPIRSSAETMMEKLSLAHPEKAEDLKILFDRFENRLFLGTTRSVQRFLEAYTGKRSKIDSRSKALPKLITLLSSLSSTELKRLAEPETGSSDSVLSQISDELLRRDR